MNITPTHNAVWAYAEWCCDRGVPWPKLTTVAADLARCITLVERAFVDLEAWGVLSRRRTGCRQFVLRLGDGRETAPVTHTIHSPNGRANTARVQYSGFGAKRRKVA